MIRLENVSKRFPGAEKPAVEDLSLELEEGAICVFVGPSGCGKTTVLKMINRLLDPSAGSIYIEEENILQSDPVHLRRKIGYVIQQIGLLPHRTVFENIGLVPRLLRWPREKIENRVHELLLLIGLDPREVRFKYPGQLSGGEMQRVGVARALAANPPIMLMDEPFGAVDPIVRSHLQDEFLKIQREMKKTIIFVTHDINEAMKMGDYIAIMNRGQLEQYGKPVEILAQPASRFVADILGEDRTMKLLELVKVESLMVPLGSFPQEAAGSRGMHPGDGNATNGYGTLDAERPVKAALEMMMKDNLDQVEVKRGQNPVGVLGWEDIKGYINRLSRETGIHEY